MNEKKLFAEVIKPDGFRAILSAMPDVPELAYPATAIPIYRRIKRDPRISSLLNIRKNAALSYRIYIKQSSADKKVYDFVKEQLFSSINPITDGRELLSCIEYGFSVSEVIWEKKGKYIVPHKLLSRAQDKFTFDNKGRLLNGNNTLDIPYKFLIARHDAEAEDPYGTSVLEGLYWIWRFKHAGLEFWLEATERCAVPSILALFEAPSERDAEERAKKLSSLMAEISSGSGGALANVKDVQVLNMSGVLKDFEVLINTCDTQISYALTGQSLATQESNYGTRAQAEVHKDSLYRYAIGDAIILENAFNTLCRWMVELNFGANTAYPKLVVDTRDGASLDDVLKAVEAGLPVSKKQLYERYGLPEPEDKDDIFVKTQSPLMLADFDKKKTSNSERTMTIRTIERTKEEKLTKLFKSFFYANKEAIKEAVNEYKTALKSGKKPDKPYSPPRKKAGFFKSNIKLLQYSLLYGIKDAKYNLHLSDNDIEELFADNENISYEEAEKIAGAKIPLSKEEFYNLSDKLKIRAFTVSRLAQIDIIEKLRKKLLKVLAEGKTVAEFIEENQEIPGFAEQNPWYWETVYRTNVQSAYNAGRAISISKDSNVKLLEFIGIEDERQTDICKTRDGILLPPDDNFWQDNWPPLHFNCRSTVRAVYTDEAKEYKLKPSKAPTGLDKPTGGFGSHPLKTEAFWQLTDNMWNRAEKYGISGEIFLLAKKINNKDTLKKLGKTYKKICKKEDNIFFAERKTKEAKQSVIDKELKAAKLLADYTKSEYILLPQAEKLGDLLDLKTGRFVEIKQIESKNITKIGKRYKEALKQGEDVLLVLKNSFPQNLIERKIQGEIKEQESPVKQHRVYIYFLAEQKMHVMKVKNRK